MSMYLKQIEQLVVLQQVDDEIIILETDLADAPNEVAELEQSNLAMQERTGQLQEKIDLLKSQQKRLGEEIEDNAHKIKKSKNKLMMVGNTREYHAMMREMDNMEKINRTREEELAALGEELKRQLEAMDEIQVEAKELEGQLAERRSSLETRMKEAKSRLDKLAKRRQKACKVVPPPILGRYEFIRARISNPVIVPVEAGVCGGCHIAIPPQIYNDLQKGSQIISCPNCQRLTYWTEHFSVDDAAAAEAKSIKQASA